MRFLLLTLAAAAAMIAVWAQSQSVSNSIGMQFVLVPAGQFQMGCSQNDKDCGADEKPVHLVKITKAFYLGKFEVTQGQWQTLMGGNPSYFNESRVGAKWMNYPVEQVSWNAVQEFLEKLNAKEPGKKYRLPSEAEWEYAARAGAADAYQGGASDRVGWSWANSGGTPHEVGQLKPNAWGAYDMLGNVWEWVDDGYDDKYYKTSPDTDPLGPEQDDAVHRSLRHPLGRGSVLHPLRKDMPRVIRGSSWYWKVGDMRVSWRRSYKQNYFDYAGGFRVVMETE
jgi:formylglycine-generating enzyme required for sulfatase activity